MRLKIMTYNVHKGFNWNQKKYLLAEMRDLIQLSKAEIVCLQEVVGYNESYQKKGLIDAQFEYLADQSWPHFSYAKNSVRESGHHGNSVLSAYPIMHWKQENISTYAFEKRGILFCQIFIPSEKQGSPSRILNILCVHLDLFSRGRRQQYEMILNYILNLNLLETDPIIVAGDFNDWDLKATPFFAERLKMKEGYFSHHQKHAKTFPAFWPKLSLDRIYVKNVRVLNAEVLLTVESRTISDHLPLLIEIEVDET